MCKCKNAEIETTLDAVIACDRSCTEDHCDGGTLHIYFMSCECIASIFV